MSDSVAFQENAFQPHAFQEGTADLIASQFKSHPKQSGSHFGGNDIRRGYDKPNQHDGSKFGIKG